MRTGIIIPCRTSSSRLPQKALIEIDGHCLIEYVIGLAKMVGGVDSVVLCTSEREDDNALEVVAKRNNIACYRGSLEDVAGRFYGAMQANKLDYAVRLNGDSPLNDPVLMGELLKFSIDHPMYDVVTNILPRSFPAGVSVEVIKREAMQRAIEAMDTEEDKEHVTRFFYQHPNMFSIHNHVSDHAEWAEINLSVDTKEDLSRFKQVVKRCPHLLEKENRATTQSIVDAL